MTFPTQGGEVQLSTRHPRSSVPPQTRCVCDELRRGCADFSTHMARSHGASRRVQEVERSEGGRTLEP